MAKVLSDMNKVRLVQQGNTDRLKINLLTYTDNYLSLKNILNLQLIYLFLKCINIV